MNIPKDSSAIREIRFAPDLDFDALVRGILAVEAVGTSGGTSGATFGAGREESAAAAPDADPWPDIAEGSLMFLLFVLGMLLQHCCTSQIGKVLC